MQGGRKMKETTKLLYFIIIFLICYFVPWDHEIIRRAGLEAFMMLQEYANEHTLLCLVPALFIAGAISVFISQSAVLKYFGASANKFLSYSVASISGSVLAVCSCTVLPLFAGIYTRGAGIGPATAFLYSGPAINVLAIMMTWKILGWQIGLARAVGAIIFSIITGLLMAFIFKNKSTSAETSTIYLPEDDDSRTLTQNALFLLTMILILVTITFAEPAQLSKDANHLFHIAKLIIAGFLFIVLCVLMKLWFSKDDLTDWVDSTWDFAKQILPFLFGGVLFAGFLLGRPGHTALIPENFIQQFVGGNSLFANLFASVSGALMYFATLTEVPILQGLIGAGMGKGPALSLLLAGPALSLPNMLVIGKVMGIKKTAVFCFIIIILSTLAGMIYGSLPF